MPVRARERLDQDHHNYKTFERSLNLLIISENQMNLVDPFTTSSNFARCINVSKSGYCAQLLCRESSKGLISVMFGVAAFRSFLATFTSIPSRGDSVRMYQCDPRAQSDADGAGLHTLPLIGRKSHRHRCENNTT